MKIETISNNPQNYIHLINRIAKLLQKEMVSFKHKKRSSITKIFSRSSSKESKRKKSLSERKGSSSEADGATENGAATSSANVG